MKKILIVVGSLMMFTTVSYAEKVECHLLSPIQKKIYKAYCDSVAKKNGQQIQKSSGGILKKLNTDSKITDKIRSSGGFLKKLKINTDSKLLKTGKYKEKK